MRTPLLLATLLLFACNDPSDPLPDVGSPLDAGPDASVGKDATPDAGDPDGGVDPEEDGGEGDASTDAGDGGPLDAGACDPFDPDCFACRSDGQCCTFSVNCQAGSICNLPSDPLADPTQPASVCIRVVCQTDADCAMGRVCTAENLCRPRICQNDSDCAGGTACLAGACTAPPVIGDVVSCEAIRSYEAIRSGGSLNLEAIARDANGAILAGIGSAASWTSSQPARVSVSGNVATGGGQAGFAALTASIGAVACTGSIDVQNFLPVAAAQVRVVAVVHGTGEPIEGAEVIVDALTASTGLDGSAVVDMPAPAAIGAISVVASGFATVSVLSPGVRDLLIPMTRIDPTVAGGYRGSIDTSFGRAGDIPIAFVGDSLSEDVLSLGRAPLTGRDLITTLINAPELGLDMQDLTLPGGLIFGVGTTQFFDNPLRCQGTSPGSAEVGCFLVRADEGAGAAWTIGGELPLSAVTAIANELSNILGGGPTDPAAVDSLIESWIPIMRTLRHGARPALVTQAFPRVTSGPADCTDPSTSDYFQQCSPDFALYQPVDLDAEHLQSLTTVVAMPALPQAGATCAPAATVFGAVYLGRRGLVPLGFGVANDVAEVEAPDCVVAGAMEPFGPSSSPLADGTLGVATAPLHSGLEGHPRALITIARVSTLGAPATFSRSVRIDRIAAFASSMTVAPLLDAPAGFVDTANATVTFNTPGGTFVRAELYGNGGAWLVYAPGGTTNLALPEVAAGRAVLSAIQSAILMRADASVGYGAVFDLGEVVRADRSFEFIDRFAVQEL